MVGTVPEDPGEVVGVGRVVHLDLLAEPARLGEGEHLGPVLDHLNGSEHAASEQGQNLLVWVQN